MPFADSPCIYESLQLRWQWLLALQEVFNLALAVGPAGSPFFLHTHIAHTRRLLQSDEGGSPAPPSGAHGTERHRAAPADKQSAFWVGNCDACQAAINMCVGPGAQHCRSVLTWHQVHSSFACSDTPLPFPPRAPSGPLRGRICRCRALPTPCTWPQVALPWNSTMPP